MGESIPQNMRGSAWRMIRKGVIARDEGKCRLCGKDLSKVPSWLTEVHHIQPRKRGGDDHPSNLLTLCTMCHKRVTIDALIAEGGDPPNSDQFLPRESLEALR
jgi:5-methylcytosine-specific restriction endonuclease McrA